MYMSNLLISHCDHTIFVTQLRKYLDDSIFQLIPYCCSDNVTAFVVLWLKRAELFLLLKSTVFQVSIAS